MKMKVILLGSAAAIAVTGVQAADLSMAEPVDYVRVCDAFGTGYWYIPGTDRCIKIGGEVTLNVEGGEGIFAKQRKRRRLTEDAEAAAVADPAVPAANVTEEVTEEVAGDWKFSTSGNVNFTTKSMTEAGVMSTYIKINVKDDKTAELNKLWASLGNFMVGLNGSAFNGSGSYTYDTPVKDGDKDAQQVRLTWAMGGYGFMLGIEDPEIRWGSSTDHDVPDFVLAMNYSHSGVSGHVGFGFTASHEDGNAWGVTADAQIALSPSSNLRIRGSYGDSDGSTNAWVGVVSGGRTQTPTMVTAEATADADEILSFTQGVALATYLAEGGLAQAEGDSSWSGHVALSQMLSDNLTAAVAFGYNDNGSGEDTYSVNANLVWSEYSGFATGVQVASTKMATGSNVLAVKWRSKWAY